MAKVLEVTDATFESEVLKSSVPVLVDFWAPWCGPCKMIAPVVEELAAEYDGKLKVAKINVDDNPLTPSRYGVRGIPNLLILKGGTVRDQIVGVCQKARLVQAIGNVL
jgi:thioredoxin 1